MLTNATNNYRIEHYATLPDMAREIRIEVFVKEQGFLEEFDMIDGTSTHFLVFDGKRTVATCRVFQAESAGSYILGRLAVRKEYNVE